jgi:hypothetical protein
MGHLWDRIRGRQPEQYHIDPDKVTGLADEPGSETGHEGQSGAPAKFESAESAAAPRAEASPERSQAAKPERLTFNQMMALGEQRANAVSARRAATREKWADKIKNFWSGAKSGAKTARTMYHAKDEIAGALGSRAMEAGKQKMENVRHSVETTTEQAAAAYAEKINQAKSFLVDKYDAWQERKLSARAAELVRQRQQALEIYYKINDELNNVESQRKMPSSPEMGQAQAA